MENITPNQFKEMLKNDGIDVSIEQAASISKFLTMLAEITVDSYLEGKLDKHLDQQDNTDK